MKIFNFLFLREKKEDPLAPFATKEEIDWFRKELEEDPYNSKLNLDFEYLKKSSLEEKKEYFQIIAKKRDLSYRLDKINKKTKIL